MDGDIKQEPRICSLSRDWSTVSLNRRRAAYLEAAGHLDKTTEHIRERMLLRWKKTLLLE